MLSPLFSLFATIRNFRNSSQSPPFVRLYGTRHLLSYLPKSCRRLLYFWKRASISSMSTKLSCLTVVCRGHLQRHSTYESAKRWFFPCKNWVAPHLYDYQILSAFVLAHGLLDTEITQILENMLSADSEGLNLPCMGCRMDSRRTCQSHHEPSAEMACRDREPCIALHIPEDIWKLVASNMSTAEWARVSCTSKALSRVHAQTPHAPKIY